MGENLPQWQTKWLTYLVFILITLLTGFTMYQNATIADVQRTVSELPKEYVQKERYNTDQARLECTLNKIDTKLDKVILGGKR